MKRIETRLVSYMDNKGGINNAQTGMARLVDAMKGETNPAGKAYEL